MWPREGSRFPLFKAALPESSTKPGVIVVIRRNVKARQRLRRVRCIALRSACSQSQNPHLRDRSDYRNSAMRPLGIDWQPEEPGTITLSVALLKQADNAHLRGFNVVIPAGMPIPIRRP